MEQKKEKKQESKKLKIFAIGDLHGDSRKAVQLAEKAKKENVDLVVLSGDITFADSSIDYLVGPFVKRNLEVFIIPGNHESPSTINFLEKLYKPGVKNIHAKGLKVKDVGIFGAGGANIGIFQLSEDEIYGALKKGFEKVKNIEKKIMITHVHPSDTLMGKVTPFEIPGSDGVRKAIERFKPDIAICSHVHEAEGIEEKIGKTRVINVGSKGKIIVI